MRLTPADVHNVAFKKPSIGKRGYDEDEVDAFLDLVEAELSRLIEENNELTQRLAAGGSTASDPAQAPQYQSESGGPVDARPAAGAQQAVRMEKAPEPTPEPVAVQQAAPVPVVVPQAAPEPQAAPQPVAQAPVAESPAPHHVQAARLLGLAQETAERLTGDAAAEAEQLRADSKTESDRVLAQAQAEADRLLSDAHNESETMVDAATSKADELERDSRVRAEAMDREAQDKYSQVMGQLTEQRTTLEKKIDDLRVYEREYRSRLKSWITDQLSQLDEGGANDGAQPVAQGAK